MTTKTYDAIVIGSGPGGYVAAIRLAQLGQQTLVIEKESMGGVCLNWGCIPSKALIAAANMYEKLHTSVATMGIVVKEVSIDTNQLQKWKGTIVNQLTKGVGQLCRSKLGEVLMGEARFVSANTLEVATKEGPVTVEARNGIIIATGSRPIELGAFKYDGKKIISAKEGVSLNPLPKRIVIIGGGIIGMELGGVYSKLGVKTTIVEFQKSVLSTMDDDLVTPVVNAMKKSKNVEFFTSTEAKGYETLADGSLRVALASEGKVFHVETDVVMIAVGMKPNSDGLGLEKVGVALDKRGHVIIDETCKTNVKGIYGIGDVVGAPYLAHKASKEGEIAAEVIAGHHSARDWRSIAAATFTHPEIASVGLSEKECREKNLDIVVGNVPFRVSGRAMAVMETEGFVKVIAEKTGPGQKDRKIVGIHIVGPEASDLISEAALAIEMDAYVEDVALTVHPHPTLGESVMEAAKHAIGEAIHWGNKKENMLK